MKSKRFTPNEIEEIFKILEINNPDIENYRPVWEVPPCFECF